MPDRGTSRAKEEPSRGLGGRGWYPGQGSNLHGTWPDDFKSSASTHSATRAKLLVPSLYWAGASA